MTAYAIANLRDVEMGSAIAEYPQRVDATLESYEGRFLVHGAAPENARRKVNSRSRPPGHRHPWRDMANLVAPTR